MGALYPQYRKAFTPEAVAAYNAARAWKGMDDKLWEQFCDAVARGHKIKDLSTMFEVSWVTVWRWINDPNYPQRVLDYNKAQEAGVEYELSEVIAIADGERKGEDGKSDVGRDRLSVETRLKVAQMKSARYSPKQTVTHDFSKLSDAELLERARAAFGSTTLALGDGEEGFVEQPERGLAGEDQIDGVPPATTSDP